MSVKHQVTLRYIRRLRHELGLSGEMKCSFSGWHQHMHRHTEKEVKKAPKILGYLIEVLREVRRKLNFHRPPERERQYWEKQCHRLHDLVKAQIKRSTRRRPELQLRSNGMFVLVVATRLYPNPTKLEPLEAAPAS